MTMKTDHCGAVVPVTHIDTSRLAPSSPNYNLYIIPWCTSGCNTIIIETGNSGYEEFAYFP
jgi:hypothetical protein